MSAGQPLPDGAMMGGMETNMRTVEVAGEVYVLPVELYARLHTAAEAAAVSTVAGRLLEAGRRGLAADLAAVGDPEADARLEEACGRPADLVRLDAAELLKAWDDHPDEMRASYEAAVRAEAGLPPHHEGS